MKCRQCDQPDTRVIDSRNIDDGAAIRRRRSCPACGFRFTTFERYEEAPLEVLKRDGSRQPFLAAKVETGIAQAVKGRPISREQVSAIVHDVTEAVRHAGTTPTTDEIGAQVLSSLKELDAVSAMRFASVYKHFEDLADFERAATELSEP